VGPTDEVGDVSARYVSLTPKAVGLIFIFRSRVQHPVAVLGWNSNDPGLQAKSSGSACTCREGTCVVHVSASFLTPDHTVSRGERYVYCTFWRLRPVPAANRPEQVVENEPITTSDTVVEEGGVEKAVITTVTTTTRTVTQVVPGDV